KWFTSGVVAPGSYRIASGGSVIHHAAERPSQPPAWTDAGADGEPAEAGHGDAAGTRASNGAGVGDGYEAYFVWPVSAIQCYPGQVINTFRWVPLAVDRTLLIREWWFDTADLTEAQSRLVSDDWENTVAEDFGIVESVQRGVASRGYTPGPLIEDPSGVCGVHSENSVRHLQDLARASLDGAV
ncbi:MAG: hypothetical protein F4Z00_15725, partial [Acidimicrobiaceae bacterium]|nr:hypothetical protein [Acidimicrobiaceae bacterium]